RKADMIGVIMRDDEPRELLPGERPGCERLPNILRALVRDAGVENRPAVSIVDEIDVDMVQPERQRHAQPENAGGNLGKFAVSWRVRKGKLKASGGRFLRHAYS